ncbi:MAG: site-specific integrase, partial [Cyanobacteria bacterium P01_H01_bin.130]
MAAERLKKLLNQANGRLKRDGYRLAIAQRGQLLILRGTLPPQEGETTPRQRRLPTKLRATTNNVLAAEKMAREVGRSLIEKTFDWGDWG